MTFRVKRSFWLKRERKQAHLGYSDRVKKKPSNGVDVLLLLFKIRMPYALKPGRKNMSLLFPEYEGKTENGNKKRFL